MSGARDPLRRRRRSKLRDLTTNRIKSAHNDRQQVVEVVGNAAGKLADRLHFLRLPEQFFSLDAGFILDFKFACALLDGFLQCFGEGPKLDDRALASGYVNIDSHRTHRPALLVVEDNGACFDPFQFTVSRGEDPELRVQLPLLRGKRGFNHVSDTRHIFAKDAFEPSIVLPIKFGQLVNGHELGREPHYTCLHLPLEYAVRPAS